MSSNNYGNYNSAVKKYTSASYNKNKVAQTIMLYESAIRCVNSAITAIGSKDVQERYNLLEKATNILQGLQSALDFEKGGEIAILLENYYFSICMRLMNVQLTENIEVCEGVIAELRLMCESWRHIDDSSNTISPISQVKNDPDQKFNMNI